MPKKIFQSAKQMWRVFIFQVGEPSKQYVKDVEEIIAVRNEIVHGAPIVKTAEELMGLAMQLRQVTPHEMRNEHEQASSERERDKQKSQQRCFLLFSSFHSLFSSDSPEGKEARAASDLPYEPGERRGSLRVRCDRHDEATGPPPRCDPDPLCPASLAGEPDRLGQGRWNPTQLDAHLGALSPGRIAAQPLGPHETPMCPLRA